MHIRGIGKKGLRLFMSKAVSYTKDKKKSKSLLQNAEKKASTNKNSLSGVWDKFQLLIAALKAWWSGEYRDIQPRSIIMITAALIYFVSPIDLIPDFLIGLGIVDDAAVLGYVFSQISKELDRFKKWKEDTEQIITYDVKDY
ncbi:YkvA family protein [Fredinandcohnia quinoae]|uniref:DUF1232 domain-containing protein n=1 Tax=Fredinandcohnia quinoae TaxID=2918902 RepID=A0AAW5EC59_9BACI|nr:YkvA family protein [Fredinandcohnia sp. SECRCQ15]MCH1627567.1 DUF1232 domain-containing protein [Fredinandcohnia sp. SECRCQ15]